MVMEYLEGKVLGKVIKEEGQLTIKRILRIAKQICKSLGESHSKGLVHRDLKPQNIMLIDHFGEKDFVKI